MRIALTGKMRSGKNTVADILTAHMEFKQFAFADGIKDIVKEYFPEALEEGKPRNHYIKIGQSFRELNPFVWINYLDKKIKEYSTNVNIVITDCRQENEEKYLRENGFVIVKVETDTLIRIKRIEEAGDIFTEEHLNHSTETLVDRIKADYTIINNGTLDSLLDKTYDVVKAEKNRRECS